MRHELSWRARCGNGTRQLRAEAKKQILNEFIAVSGYHRKYAIHLLNSAEAAATARRGRVRPTIYDDAAKQASDRAVGSIRSDLRKATEAAVAYPWCRHLSGTAT